MKHLLVLLIVTLSFNNLHAQDTLVLPAAVAKQIVKDLVICDSTKAVLEVTKEELSLTQQKVVLKDSLLSNAGMRIENLQGQLVNQTTISNNYSKLYDDAKEQYKNLAKEYKKYKVKQNVIKGAGAIVIGLLVYLHFIK